MIIRDAKGRFAPSSFRPDPQPFMPPAAWRNMAPNPPPVTDHKDPDLSPARCVGMAAMLVSLVFVIGTAVAAFSGLHWG